MKLYTRTGDAGLTSLAGGRRIEKDALRIETYGSVDELNSFIGVALTACDDDDLQNMLMQVQCRLFEIGAELARPDGAGKSGDIAEEAVVELEKQIDMLCEPLEPMRSFILPGGCVLAAHLHVARAVCRRVERLCVALGRKETVNGQIVVYLNRLSDMLFAMARRANQLANVVDVPWGKDF
jgi:cob(I)alamin adenosyltransferase